MVSKFQALKGQSNDGRRGRAKGECLGCSHLRGGRWSPRSPQHPPGFPLPGLYVHVLSLPLGLLQTHRKQLASPVPRGGLGGGGALQDAKPSPEEKLVFGAWRFLLHYSAPSFAAYSHAAKGPAYQGHTLGFSPHPFLELRNSD